jgi:hypothetical protein
MRRPVERKMACSQSKNILANVTELAASQNVLLKATIKMLKVTLLRPVLIDRPKPKPKRIFFLFGENLLCPGLTVDQNQKDE